jgi:hypothetical protein
VAFRSECTRRIACISFFASVYLFVDYPLYFILVPLGIVLSIYLRLFALSYSLAGGVTFARDVMNRYRYFRSTASKESRYMISFISLLSPYLYHMRQSMMGISY